MIRPHLPLPHRKGWVGTRLRGSSPRWHRRPRWGAAHRSTGGRCLRGARPGSGAGGPAPRGAPAAHPIWAESRRSSWQEYKRINQYSIISTSALVGPLPDPPPLSLGRGTLGRLDCSIHRCALGLHLTQINKWPVVFPMTCYLVQDEVFDSHGPSSLTGPEPVG